MTTISPALIVVLVVIGLAELVLFLWALIDLIRRPQVKYLPRWAWIVIIFVFELVGSIVYLAIGRGETTVVEAPLRPAQAARAVKGAGAETGADQGGGAAEASEGAAASPDSERLAAELQEQRAGKAIDALYGPRSSE